MRQGCAKQRWVLKSLVAVGAYIEKHGSFADMVRAHYTIKDDED
jgi:hypothetical protein